MLVEAQSASHACVSTRPECRYVLGRQHAADANESITFEELRRSLRVVFGTCIHDLQSRNAVLGLHLLRQLIHILWHIEVVA